MNDKFDELAKAMAQSVTRRSALKKFGVGLVGAALAALGLGKAEAAKPPQGARYRCCLYIIPGYRSSRVCVPFDQLCPVSPYFAGYNPVQNCSHCK